MTQRSGQLTLLNGRLMMSKARLNSVPTNVRTIGNRIVSIEPGKPWPGVYRGSTYSIVKRNEEPTLLLRYKDIDIEGALPDGLVNQLQRVGKSAGDATGTIRITANRDVLTKVHADEYPHADEALVSEGWIPVYLGKLAGTIAFDWLTNDPAESELEPPCVWEGLPFNHGERWSVTVNGDLQWRINNPDQFRFPSAYTHTDLTKTYASFRATGGRLRVNEYGHIWMELPRAEAAERADLQDMLREWLQTAKQQERNRLAKLLVERLRATGGGDPQAGNIPLYLGHISQYDTGNVPSPVITDKNYYVQLAQGEPQ